jgi:hypothetical protein
MRGLARQGVLFSVGQALTATAVNGAQFALFNPAAKGLPLIVFSCLTTSSVAIQVQLFKLIADPGLAAGNTPVNLLFQQPGTSGKFEAAVAAQPSVGPEIGELQLSTGLTWDLIDPFEIIVSAGQGLLVSTPAVAATVSVRFVWAEMHMPRD